MKHGLPASARFAALVAGLILGAAACTRERPPVATRAADAGTPAATPAPPDPLADVVDPWTFPHAAAATSRERATENIGPYEIIDGRPQSPNARYWSDLVGLAFDRDVDIDVVAEPIDLDGDGAPDARVSRHLVAKRGILGSPEVFGLVPTPEDPRGRRGRITASTGVLGLREELDAAGRPTGRIGMTCWLCHGGRNPVDGKTVLGLANPDLDYGALLATARVLDESDVAAASARRVAGAPRGATVRARLLLVGPGRQDLTGEFGLDSTVPGTHSLRYAGTRRLRQGTKGVFNPLSVPSIVSWPWLSTQNWSGSESAADPWLERAGALLGLERPETLEALHLPAGDEAEARRALLLDLRNLGTLGLQQDSFPGLLWADALRSRAQIPAATVRRIPELYVATDVRAEIASGDDLARPRGDAAAIARGEAIFEERFVGEIVNRQVLKNVPSAYAASKITAPVLAAIDPGFPTDAKLKVRCASCHGMSGAYSTGRILPFDADLDGVAQGDEADDRNAGGIGTEPLLAFDVPAPERPFSIELPLISDPDRAGAVRRVRTGVTWVRVAPLQGVRHTAPYLHNGSVPTLRALLDPPANRPRTFALGRGKARFMLDTRLSGNGNGGHEFGLALTPREKDDLVAFLESL